MNNTFKTFLYLGLLTVLMVFLGRAIGGQGGMLFMLLISLGMNFAGYWYSDKIVLNMSGAKEISRTDAPQIYSIIEKLISTAKLPMPKIYMTEDSQPNAFATGRNPEHASVAVTKGLLNLLDPDEIRGVLAHELAHIKNRDILIGSIAAMMAGVVSYAANILQWGAMFGGGQDEEEGGGNPIALLAMAIIAPIAAILIQMAVSRSREFQADETGARIAEDTRGLSSALSKLEYAAQRVPLEHANPSTAHMYISNPLKRGGLMSLFSTHPAAKDRIKRLSGLKL